MTAARGAPSVGTLGSAGVTQQIIGISEQVKHSAEPYKLQSEIDAIDAALTRIYLGDEVFADYRRGVVDFPLFGLATKTFRVNVMIIKRDVADLPGEC